MKRRRRRGKDFKERAAKLWEQYLVYGSVKSVSKVTGVPETTIRRLLKVYIGSDYKQRAQRSLYRSINENSYGRHQEEVTQWLVNNVEKLADLDADGNDFFSENYINNALIRRSSQVPFNDDIYDKELYQHPGVADYRGRYEFD